MRTRAVNRALNSVWFSLNSVHNGNSIHRGHCMKEFPSTCTTIWTTSSEFGTYRLCEQRRFRRDCAVRRACASAQSRQNLCCSLKQAVNQAEPSDRKPDPLPLWMAGHAQLKFVMTECSKTQIRLTGLICMRASSQETKPWRNYILYELEKLSVWHVNNIYIFNCKGIQNLKQIY